MKKFSEVRSLPEFEKDLKKLRKRFESLDSDLDTFIQSELGLYHKLKIDNGGVFQISGLNIEHPKIFKAKKFACRALKNKGVHSGIRVIYAYFEKEDQIDLIEIYYKGDKANEDRQRILKYY